MRWLKRIFGVKELETRISDLEGKVDLYGQILKEMLDYVKETNLKIDSNYPDVVKRLDRVENRVKRYIGRKLKEFLKKD
jgi:uncharacterized coiled-coil protein SlyX